MTDPVVPPARLAAALALALALPAAPAAAVEGLLLTSDYDHARVRVVDLATRQIVYDLPTNTADINPRCGNKAALCAPLGMRYVKHDDRDYVDVAVTVMKYRETSPFTMMPSVLTRFQLTSPPTRVWQVEHLDFRGIPEEERACVQADDEAYGDPLEPGCALQLTHAVDVIHDDPASSTVSFLAADLVNLRILGATLDYSEGSTTATVDWILGMSHPDWPRFGLPNGARWVDDGGAQGVLVSFYATGDVAGASAGAVAFFQLTDEGFRRAWQFPDPSSGETPLLQAPHMAQVLTDPTTGRPWLFYAHGRGLSSDWGTDPNTDLGGTIGVLGMGASILDRPAYYGEGVPLLDSALSDPLFAYARDIDLTDDGLALLSDAGCENVCEANGKVLVVEPFHTRMSPSDKAGWFSADHAQQDLVDISSADVVDTIECDLGGIFESHWIPTEDAGLDLRRALREDLAFCPQE